MDMKHCCLSLTIQPASDFMTKQNLIMKGLWYESPEGIDSMKSMDFWELKVMDLKQMIKDYIRINKL